MMTLIIIIHVIACIALIGLVLIQRGRGGGLVESFSGVESMFGTKTSAFLTRSTTVLSVIFFITCLSLAVLSIKQSRSLMRNVVIPAAQETEQATPAAQTPADAKAADETKAAAATTQVAEPATASPGTAAGAQAPFTQAEPEDMQKAAQTQKTDKTEGVPQNK